MASIDIFDYSFSTRMGHNTGIDPTL